MIDDITGFFLFVATLVIIAVTIITVAVMTNNSNNSAKLQQLQVCSKVESANFNACLKVINK